VAVLTGSCTSGTRGTVARAHHRTGERNRSEPGVRSTRPTGCRRMVAYQDLGSQYAVEPVCGPRRAVRHDGPALSAGRESSRHLPRWNRPRTPLGSGRRLTHRSLGGSRWSRLRSRSCPRCGMARDRRRRRYRDLVSRTLAACSRSLRARLLAVDVSRSGRWLVTAGRPAAAAVWDSKDGRRVSSLPGAATARTVVFSDDDRRIYLGQSDGTLAVWDWVDGVAQGPRRMQSADARSLR
jgi:hypothetical protein